MVEVGQQRCVIEITFQFGTHEKMTAGIIHEFIIVDDVELMLVTNIGDSGDLVPAHQDNASAGFFFPLITTSMQK